MNLIPSVMMLAIIIPLAASARNVDLSTVPKRDTVDLTIYNSEDLTLVRETRSVTFKKGVNPLQFSWANTLIDPTSVKMRFLSNAEKLDVLDTTFPHDKPQMLFWNVQSEIDGEARIEITYFTSGITWSADYLCVADKNETQMTLDGFVRVTNHSGEEYENAHVRLVVGTINLVEKIAQLAQIRMQEVELMDRDQLRVVKRKAALETLSKMMPASQPQERGAADADEKQIIKEGLSEYFIFSIAGTETIPNGWSKRMRSLEAATVPLKIQYRYRPQEYGENLVRMYLLANNKDSKLGDSPLPDGTVRVFRDNGRGGLSYLTAQAIKYIPVGDKIELNLGTDPNVLFELIKLKAYRDDLWLQVHGTNVYRTVVQAGLHVEPNTSVAGWNEHEIYSQRIHNFTGSAIELEVRRGFEGHVVFRSGLKPILYDYRTVQFTTPIPAGQKADLLFEVESHLGHNAKQSSVTLENKDISR